MITQPFLSLLYFPSVQLTRRSQIDLFPPCNLHAHLVVSTYCKTQASVHQSYPFLIEGPCTYKTESLAQVEEAYQVLQQTEDSVATSANPKAPSALFTLEQFDALNQQIIKMQGLLQMLEMQCQDSMDHLKKHVPDAMPLILIPSKAQQLPCLDPCNIWEDAQRWKTYLREHINRFIEAHLMVTQAHCNRLMQQ
ncbi:hypothetical protein BD324DRAFT_607387 [Kockovaella imperatae]|uniref:Uncharacterized protein n=1 Tax=Kockovaella imperatae TaxID=4999 RepID=A0A1Y1UP45_9TREE|nr:hypothetical protein BD324DRAFT_607387 [Kockovaella imperatae]ORX38885.1 hypothetical protein BD324DRAFT_607387 [Kockovaella imperatae]